MHEMGTKTQQTGTHSLAITAPKALAAMAGASAAFLAAGTAEGAIFSGTGSWSITGDATPDLFAMWLTSGGSGVKANAFDDAASNSITGLPLFGLYGFGNGIVAAAPDGIKGMAPFISRLAAGDIIGTTNPSAFAPASYAGFFLATVPGSASTWLGGGAGPVSGYIGFWVPGSPGNFGWVEITVYSVSSATITGWGIESTPWTPIAAGATGATAGGEGGEGGGGSTGTPEPAASGLGLLALGAAGVMRRKRQRQAA